MLEAGYASAISRVDDPSPQPTSATVAPTLSFSSTPSRAGSQEVTRLALVAGAEESLAAGVHAGVVLVPAEAGAALEGGLDAGLRPERCRRQLEGAADERRAVLVGERLGLLGRQQVLAGAGDVLHVAAGRLAVQPSPHVAPVGP